MGKCSDCGKAVSRSYVTNKLSPEGRIKRCKPCHLKFLTTKAARVALTRMKVLGARQGMTKPERDAASLLTWLGLPWGYQVEVAGYAVDFVVGDLAIEVNGQYWHRNRLSEDRRRAREIESEGYRVIELWEGSEVAWLSTLVGATRRPGRYLAQVVEQLSRVS
jgi:very-short-patch-repair endonuclease